MAGTVAVAVATIPRASATLRPELCPGDGLDQPLTQESKVTTDEKNRGHEVRTSSAQVPGAVLRISRPNGQWNVSRALSGLLGKTVS